MIKTDELFNVVVSLPVDIRTRLVDKLLQSLHSTQKKIDKLWVIEAEKRVKEIKNGKVTTIPGEEVFKKVRNRLCP